MREVTSIVLAGGLGTRLRSIVADRPKVMAEVNGRPFLAYILDQIAAAGMRRAILCVGYMSDYVQDYFSTDHAGVELVYSREEELLGTAGALRLAEPLVNTDSLCVMNGDSYCALDLPAFWSWHLQHDANVSMALVSAADTSRYGVVETDAADRIVRFIEKKLGGGPGWINAGIYLLPVALVRKIPKARRVSLERDTLPNWIGKGMFGRREEKKFIDIGTPESYQDAAHFFASGQAMDTEFDTKS